MAEVAEVLQELAHNLHADAWMGQGWGSGARQEEQIIHLELPAGSLDSALVKALPDGTSPNWEMSLAVVLRSRRRVHAILMFNFKIAWKIFVRLPYGAL